MLLPCNRVSHISDKFLFIEFVVLILLSLFHIFFVEYRFVALSQVSNRYFTIGLISVSYLKARPLFTSEQQKLTVTIVPTKSDSHVIFCLQLLSI